MHLTSEITWRCVWLYVKPLNDIRMQIQGKINPDVISANTIHTFKIYIYVEIQKYRYSVVAKVIKQFKKIFTLFSVDTYSFEEAHMTLKI